MAISSISASSIPSLNPNPNHHPHPPSKLSSFSSLQCPSLLQFGARRISSSSSSSRSRNFPVVSAKKQTFSNLDELLENADKPVLVDFYATWCGPCQLMTPILNEVSSILKDSIQVVKIDTEKYPAIGNKYRIEALPTFILFKDGKPCDRFEGALTKDRFIERIQNSLQVKQ